MPSSSLRSLVTLFAILVVTPTLLAKQSFQVLNVQREIDVSKNYAEVFSVFEVKIIGDGAPDPFVICSKKKAAKREAYFKAVIGGDLKAGGLNVTRAVKNVDAPESVSCKGLIIPENQRPKADEALTVSVHAVFTDLMQPLPESVRQVDEQKMMLRDNLYSLLPYKSEKQMTSVKLPSGEVYSKTVNEPFRQEGEKLIYGPYRNVPPFKVQMLSVHFAHNNRFATATKVIKEVQISLWGRVYVEEIYEIENTGAKLSGQWSRLDYTSQPQAPGAVITEFVAEVPRVSSAMYFTDAIGNISTSRLGVSASLLMAVLRPRYPLFGGWKTKFKFGYSVPLHGSLHVDLSGRHVLPVDFLPSISNLVILDYELRVVVPDGSHGISYKLPFDLDTKLDKKHWYFDLVPRPVLVIRKQNVVPLHDSVATVSYWPTVMAHYRKLFIFMSVLFCSFLAHIVGSRLDFTIVGSKEEKKETIQFVMSQMKILFKDHQDSVQELRSCITQMKNNHTANKTVSTKNRIESKLKETENKLREGVASLRGAQFKRLYDITDLVSKATDYHGHSIQLWNKVESLLEAKTSKKEIDHAVQVMEKTVAHLAAGVQDAMVYIFQIDSST